jgi:hypothetical protein
MDNVIDKLLLEWSWRCEKGYPDINNPADKKVLDKLLAEYGVSLDNIKNKLQEQEEDLIKHDTTEGDLENLRKALEEIKEPYAKYLSVFYYFDPNSLGTISEVLLTKLLNSVQGIEAKHVGEGQGLADIVINGKTISLKTTSATKHIGLGNDVVTIDQKDTKEVVDALYSEKEKYSTVPVSELSKVAPSEIVKKIQDRLKAIASKVAGDSEDEYFVWVQKFYGEDKYLSKLIIHALNYDYSKVLEEFYNGYLYLTAKAWGIKDKNGTIIVQADTTGKLLNITPAFVEKSSKDKKIVVDLGVSNLKDKVNTQLLVSQEMFKALDSIYGVIVNNKE